MRSDEVVSVVNLRKSYGDVVALDGIGFSIAAGEIFGLLGPNGAGKTTLVEILEGLRSPDAGEVRVCGLDPAVDGHDLRGMIGVQLQSSAFYPLLKVREVCEEFAAFYRRHADIAQLLDTFGLGDKAGAFINTLSGGQHQRLAVALALLPEPQLLFLDEPTAGLDPQSRRDVWELLKSYQRDGGTIVVTTHYIEEAERLCDRVAILEVGRILALDAPGRLIEQSREKPRIRLTTEKPVAWDPDAEDLRRHVVTVGTCEYQMQVERRQVGAAITALTDLLDRQGNQFVDISIARPSLEDVFIELTGKKIDA